MSIEINNVLLLWKLQYIIEAFKNTQQFSSHTRLWCFLLRIDDFVYLL